MIAAPLTDLLKDETVWKWEDKQETAFRALKRGLTEAPVLAYPDYGMPFKLEWPQKKTIHFKNLTLDRLPSTYEVRF